MATRKASCNCEQLSVSYEGPDPERISLCQCYECQKRTGSVLAVQTRLPIEHVTIDGRSTTWAFPSDSGKPAAFRSCDSGGATYHFCPECGSTVYWEISAAPDVLGVAVGPSKGWWPILRLYSPLQPFFDKTWRPSEIEPLA